MTDEQMRQSYRQVMTLQAEMKSAGAWVFGGRLHEPGTATARGQDVLHDVSFTAPAGRLTALVGPSGAGKTTITHLVARLYDPGAGTVRIGGADIRDITLASLRDTVGVVIQDAHLT
jgi:ABC-type multidrug transport system fused ATPase/permease subunit